MFEVAGVLARVLLSSSALGAVVLVTACSTQSTPVGQAAMSQSPPRVSASASAATPPSASTQARSVVITKSQRATTSPSCSAGCNYVAITTTGFASVYSCDVFDDTAVEPWIKLAYDGNVTANERAYYGFPGRTVHVVCDGVRSNDLTW